MKYYKNTEIAALFHVSEKAVRNWIESSQQGKLGLELYEKNGRFSIANTSKNLQIIEELVAGRKKFKNSRGYKVVTPKPEFYDLYTTKEIADIIVNIDVHNEIPLRYGYFNGGAIAWEQYIKHLKEEDIPNTTHGTAELLRLNEAYVDGIIGTHQKVNIIDLGVGDCSPVRGLLTHLLSQGKLARYIAIDLSDEMLHIAERNIKDWFGDRVAFEAYKRDINYELFKDLVVEESYAFDGEEPLNMVLFFGGTLSNMRQPDMVLRMIANSMKRDDILLTSLKVDSEMSRRFFHDKQGDLNQWHKQVLELLNIDSSLYEVEQYYDNEQRARYKRAKLKLDISIKFSFPKGDKIINLKKDQSILVWRATHKTVSEVVEQFNSNGFDLIQASTKDQSFLLTMSKIKIGHLH